jgi:hypothetical protein
MFEGSTSVQFPARNVSAKVVDPSDLETALMSSGFSLYPLDDEKDAATIRTSIALEKDLDEDVAFIAELWNAFDEVRGISRDKKWKKASVMQRMIQFARQVFGEQIEGFPRSPEERAAFIRNAKAKLEQVIKAEQGSGSVSKLLPPSGKTTKGR